MANGMNATGYAGYNGDRVTARLATKARPAGRLANDLDVILAQEELLGTESVNLIVGFATPGVDFIPGTTYCA